MMREKLAVLRQSTITRIIVVVIALVLPVNIITLVLAGTVIRSNRAQVYQEIENSLEMAVSSMEAQINASYRRVTLLNTDNTDFRVLEYLSEDIDRMESLSSYSAVTNELKNVCSESTMVNLAYFQFRSRDKIITQGSMGISSQTLKAYIAEICDEDSVSSARWSVAVLDDIPILVSHTLWNNADYGLVINLNMALTNLSFETGEGRYIFFVSEDGTVVTSTGSRLFASTGMTLEQLSEDSSYQVITTECAQYGLILVEVLEVASVANVIPTALFVLETIAILLTALVIPVLLWYINRNVSRPLRRLTGAMDQIESGDLEFRIPQTEGKSREFEQINRNFNSMMEEVKTLKIDAYETELARRDIVMKYLSRQIQPHFILNALNIMYCYEQDEYPLIQKMILCLSKYFRYIVRVNSKFVQLQQEMDHINNYFEIQKIRYGDAFSYEIDYDEELKEALLPVLLVQNFAENAIKYALKAGRNVLVRVTAEYAKEQDGDLPYMLIRVTDTGDGMGEEILEKIARFKETGKEQEGLGVGITNSIERLKHFYDLEKTEVRFYRKEEAGETVVEFWLPVHMSMGEENDVPLMG